MGVHIFPLKRVDWYKGWKQTIKGGVLQTSKLCTYIYKTKLKKKIGISQAENKWSDISVMLLGVSLQHYHGTRSGCKKHINC